MEKEQLKQYLIEGKSTRIIAPLVGLGKSTVAYYIHKWELEEFMKYKKPVYTIDFNKIDTPEKAYIIGYFLADGYLNEDHLEFGCSIEDKEILEYISKITGSNLVEDWTMDVKKRRFPRARISIGNKNILIDFLKHCSAKEEKHIPIISKSLRRFLVLGFFDGDGCITWGYRKDRSRLWHKISFTSSYRVLEGIQDILLKDLSIASKIKPKKDENCFVLEFANKSDVEKFLNYIYPSPDFIVLKRKYKKANALRLNWVNSGNPRTPSEAIEEIAVERVETRD